MFQHKKRNGREDQIGSRVLAHVVYRRASDVFGHADSPHHWLAHHEWNQPVPDWPGPAGREAKQRKANIEPQHGARLPNDRSIDLFGQKHLFGIADVPGSMTDQIAKLIIEVRHRGDVFEVATQCLRQFDLLGVLTGELRVGVVVAVFIAEELMRHIDYQAADRAHHIIEPTGTKNRVMAALVLQ